MHVLLSATIFVISSRSVSKSAHTVLVQVKEIPGKSLRINTVCNFLTIKSAAELNKLLSRLLLLFHIDIQESSPKRNAKFNFLGIIWENKMPCRVLFLGFQWAYNPKFSLQWQPWCHLRDILGGSNVWLRESDFLWEM